jgi:hypothetical protein
MTTDRGGGRPRSRHYPDVNGGALIALFSPDLVRHRPGRRLTPARDGCVTGFVVIPDHRLSGRRTTREPVTSFLTFYNSDVSRRVDSA